MNKWHLVNFAMLTFCLSLGTACDSKKPEQSEDTGSAADDDDDSTSSADDDDDDAAETGETGEPTHMGECKVGLQDCPNDLKCTGKLRGPDSTYVDDSHCVEVVGDKKVGEECIRDGTDFNDDCGKGLYCFAGCTACTGAGVCEQFCDAGEASDEELSTACAEVGLPDHYCFNFNDGFFPVCKLQCNPLSDACDEGEGCYAGVPPEFLCSTTKLPEGKDGKDRTECNLVQSCLPGNVCALQERVTGCDAERCCTIFCDLEDKEFTCPTDGESCLPVYETPKPGNENVGMCALPAE